MVITGLLHWWYIDGWLGQLARVRWAFIKTADYFSIGSLLKTLFAPFRQISADEQARGGAVVNVLVDKLVSRLIGGFMRIVMIVVGVVALVGLAILSLMRLVLWPMLPVAPIVGVVLMVGVGAPWKLI